MAYRIYINHVLLPVTPSSVKLKVSNKNKTLDLLNGSQVNLVNLPGLSEISFSFLIPHVKYPFAVYEGGFLPPSYYIGLLEHLKTHRKAFEFEVIRSDAYDYNTSMTVTLEDYTVEESAKDGNDFTADVTLKEYTERKTKTVEILDSGEVQIVEATADDTSVSETTSIPINNSNAYTVKKGDTLWSIAKINYGDSTKWKTIYQNNSAVIEAAAKAAGYTDSLGGSMIFPGTVLQL